MTTQAYQTAQKHLINNKLPADAASVATAARILLDEFNVAVVSVVNGQLLVAGNQVFTGNITTTTGAVTAKDITATNSLTVNGAGVVTLANDGGLMVSGFSTSDPHVAGKVWLNSNVMTVSAG